MVVDGWISQVVDLENASMPELVPIVELLIVLLQVIFHPQVALYIAHALYWKAVLLL